MVYTLQVMGKITKDSGATISCMDRASSRRKMVGRSRASGIKADSTARQKSRNPEIRQQLTSFTKMGWRSWTTTVTV
jgi:hypothetical protein